MFEVFRKEIMWGGRRLTLETGRIARQADGAVLATYGETTVLCTAVAMKQPKPGQDENPRRLVVMSEKHAGEAPWLLGAYDVSQETPYTFSSISQFNCKPNRGGDDKSFFIVNHWLRPDGPPDPVEAAQVNSQKVLTARLQRSL